MLCLAETRNEISVVCDQIGSPTYAGNLAKFIIHIIKTKEQDYGTYHYSNSGEISWFDFAKAIFELVNKPIRVKPIKTEAYPTAANRPMYSVLDKTKTKDTFNFEIPLWRDSLIKCLVENNL